MYKPVIVYGISETAYEYVSNVMHFQQVEMEQVKVSNTNEFITNHNRKINAVPVKRFVIDGENVYIAIHPHLEEIINYELKEENANLHKKLNQAYIDCREIIDEAYYYQERVFNYNKLPWYKRMFKKV